MKKRASVQSKKDWENRVQEIVMGKSSSRPANVDERGIDQPSSLSTPSIISATTTETVPTAGGTTIENSQAWSKGPPTNLV